MHRKPLGEDAIYRIAVNLESEALREEYLRQACNDDGALYDRVAILLNAHDEEPDFLESPLGGVAATLDFMPVAERLGTKIGPYKLVEEIGEGGMGSVYMATQEEPVRRRVALKVIKPGMDSKQVVSRFEAERQALAMMDHPNIARVIDGGTTDAGRPYFVMELVKGIPITDYADRHRLTTKDRLELFGDVCRAVQHAHQKGIIHRDLKPSNILVTQLDEKATPKVIDFGIAKATSGHLMGASMVTGYSQLVGTPMYMSPEQAEPTAVDVDTRSDVYSLGVLLYELLTGTTPFDRKRMSSVSFDEFRRIVREEDPPRPSTRLSTLDAALDTVAEKHHTDPRTLNQQLNGELDWIVMKSLEKERSRRYESANELAKDVQRYLNDEAVQACPASASYRFGKFARRNKAVLTTLAVVTTALIAGIIGTSWQAIRAEKNLELANTAQKRAEGNLKLATAEQRRAEGNLDLALEALDAVYLDAIGEEKLLGVPLAQPDDEEIRFVTPPPLTDLERELLERGLSFYDQFAQQNAVASRAFVQTAQAYYRVGLLQNAVGDLVAADDAYRSAIERFERLAKEEPNNFEHFRRLGDAYRGLSNVVPEWDAAKKLLEDGRRAYTRAIELNPEDPALYLGRGADGDYEKALQLDANNVDALLKCSFINLWKSGYSDDRKEAREYAERAVALAPNNPHCHLALARALGLANISIVIGAARSAPMRAAALKHYARAIELAPGYAGVYGARGHFYSATGDTRLALADLNRALELKPDDCSALRVRAGVLSAIGQSEKALADLAKILQILPHDRETHSSMARIHLQKENWQSAIDSYTRVLEIYTSTSSSSCYKRLAWARVNLGQHEQALADIKKALALNPRDTSALRWDGVSQLARSPDLRRRLMEVVDDAVERSPSPARAHIDRAELFRQLGEYEKAEADLAKAAGIGSQDSSNVWLCWGRVCLARGMVKEAHEKLSQGVQVSPDYWVLYWDRAFVNYRLNDLPAVLHDLNRVLELNPALPEGFSQRHDVYFRLGEFQKALADLTTALELRPQGTSVLAHFSVAELKRSPDDFRQAMLALAEKGVESTHGSASSLVARAAILLAVGDKQRAQADLKAVTNDAAARCDDLYLAAVLAANYGQQENYQLICRSLVKRFGDSQDPSELHLAAWSCVLAPRAVDDMQPVLEMAERLVTQAPNSPRCLQKKGAALYRAGQYDLALETLQRAEADVKDKSTSALNTSYMLAMTHHQLKHADEAMQTLATTVAQHDKQAASQELAQPGLLTWNRTMALDLFRQEAQSLIGDEAKE